MSWIYLTLTGTDAGTRNQGNKIFDFQKGGISSFFRRQLNPRIR
jgi:hypothetical protein